MAELLYRVTFGADEASARNPLISNSFLVELVCGKHSDLLESDPSVAARDVARKVIEHHFSEWPQSHYLIADKAEDVSASDFGEWKTLDCGCRAAVIPSQCGK